MNAVKPKKHVTPTQPLRVLQPHEATSIKEQEERYKWIQDIFSWKNLQECPISNEEAIEFLHSIKKTIKVPDSVLKESILDFSNKIFSLEQFEEKITKEQEAKQVIAKYKMYKKDAELFYKKINDKEIHDLHTAMIFLGQKVKSLINRDEEWTTRSVKDCLSGESSQWNCLYNDTNRILDEIKNPMLVAEKIESITGNKKILSNQNYVQQLLQNFFNKYKKTDKIRWGMFCSLSVRRLKKIKINDINISSYEDVEKFKDYMMAEQIFKKINTQWRDQDINIQNQNLKKNYNTLKDFCEILKDCLTINDFTKEIKGILERCKIPYPHLRLDSIESEISKIEYIIAQNEMQSIAEDFKNIVCVLEKYKNQKNNIAKKIIFSYASRDLKAYNSNLKGINLFKEMQIDLLKITKINKKINNSNFHHNIKNSINDALWGKRLKNFEQAWGWHNAKIFLKEEIDEESLEQLKQKKSDFSEKQKSNMARNLLAKIATEEVAKFVLKNALVIWLGLLGMPLIF